jgi:hypothetical protein
MSRLRACVISTSVRFEVAGILSSGAERPLTFLVISCFGSTAARHWHRTAARCAGRLVSPTSDAWSARLTRTFLLPIWGVAPGTGFLRPETLWQKSRYCTNGPGPETERAHITAPIRGYLSKIRNAPQVCDCVVELRGLELRARHAVLSNGVSCAQGREARVAPQKAPRLAEMSPRNVRSNPNSTEVAAC